MKYSLGEIAGRFNLSLDGDPDIPITGLANLPDAGPGDLAFLFNPGYQKYLETTSASAVVVKPAIVAECGLPSLASDNPRLIWAEIAALFDPAPAPDGQQHPGAIVDSSAILGQGVTLGPGVVVAAGAKLGNNVAVGAGTVIGEQAEVGDGTVLFANVSIYHQVKIGAGCRIHSSAVIGADGFGYEFDGVGFVKIPQIYAVQIGDNVEIGAGTTIDRGALNHTRIGDNVKLDNQVQIGHGTRVGSNTVISGCTAIAGSTTIGSYCMIGGAVGIVDNIVIVDQVEVTAMSLVSQSILDKGRYSSGTGLMQSKEWKRAIVGFKKIDNLIKRVRQLEWHNKQ